MSTHRKWDEAHEPNCRPVGLTAVGYMGGYRLKGGLAMGIGVSIFLMAVGAIFAFAINVSAEGINLDTLGVILIILGLVGLLASLVWWNDWTPNRRTVAYDDAGDRVVVRHRGPRVVTIDDADADGDLVDVVEDRPGRERRRVTTRRTTYDGF